MKYSGMTGKEALAALEVDAARGLPDKLAARRLETFGANVLAEKKPKPLLVRFFLQFNDFMVLTLLGAAGVSFIVSLLEREMDFADPILILLIVSLNAILGLVQEGRAARALEALRRMSAPTAQVLRGGRIIRIAAAGIVPGDVLYLEAGDVVPADGRLITTVNLKAEEAALTGESVPAEKDAALLRPHAENAGDMRNMVFTGSSIVYGRGTAVVTATGMDTEMGRIAALINADDSDAETPLQQRLSATGKTLGIGALVICAVIFGLGLLRRIPPFEMFMTSVSLAVAAIPEGLPAIVTIMLAIGVRCMARRNAVVRRLPAVETLGSATVICSDKTGTLTQNKMRVTDIYAGDKSALLRMAALCTDCRVEEENGQSEVVGDPTEAALVRAALAHGLDKRRLDGETPRAAEIPFDSQRKLMTTVHQYRGWHDEGWSRSEERNPGIVPTAGASEHTGAKTSGVYLSVTKGAPDVLLDACTHEAEKDGVKQLSNEKRAEIMRACADMAARALRVLGVAYKQSDSPRTENAERGMTFAGLLGMIDPPREEAAEAVAVCQNAGIRPVMVTGDHAATAAAIAKQLGILHTGDKVMTGAELNRTPQDELEAEIHRYSVFARVSPAHKVRIVKAFQARGNVVAMTGDGVNDAPALKAADIGCAMGQNGTDVAKAAADMVLTDDNFATIVDAVREGRGIYANIRKAVHFLLSSNIGEILTIFSAMLMGWDTPLLAIHLLWVNLVTDSLPAIALGLDAAEDSIMNEKPVDKKDGLFAGGLWQRITLEGCMIGLLALIAFGIGTIVFDAPGSHLIGRTMAFATLSISQLVHAFNMRSEKSLFAIDPLGNRQLVGAFVIGLALQVGVVMIPPLAVVFKVAALSAGQWLITAGLCLVPLVVVELEKKLGR